MGYRLLPVSDLPTIDYPTIQVKANLPGASPDTMAASVATPLEKQFSTIAGVTSISSQQRPGQHQHHAAVRLEPRHRLRRAGRAVDDRARVARSLPPGMPSPPSYQKVNPADQPVLFLTLSSDDAAAVAGRSVRRDRAGAAAVDGQRRRRRQRVRRAEVRGPHRRRSDAARLAADRHRPGRAGDRRRQRQPADRHALRPAAQLRRADERAVDERRGATGRSRSPTATAARSASSEVAQRLRRRRESAQRQLVQRHAGASTSPSQRQPGTNTVEVVDAIKALLPRAAGAAAGVARAGDPQRSLGLDPRVGRRRQVHAAPDGLPRRAGHLPVPAGTSRRRSSPAWRCRSRSSARSR